MSLRTWLTNPFAAKPALPIQSPPDRLPDGAGPQPFMIETLVGEGITRPDDKVMGSSRRTAPASSRDLFGIIMGLGEHTSIQTLMKATDLRDMEPRTLVHVVLDRWPTSAELARCRSDYDPRKHVRELLQSEEFGAQLAYRICAAFPERPRQLYVRLPRCAGRHFLDTVAAANPIFPASLGPSRPRATPGSRFAHLAELGRFLANFGDTRTILLEQASMAPFRTVAQPEIQPNATLPWSTNPPPHRPADRLFTILRDPMSLILSQVNAQTAALLRAPAHDDRSTALWRPRLVQAGLPHSDQAAYPEAVARMLLAEWPSSNPICNALGNGTAAGTIEACGTANIEITDLDHYASWVRYSWSVEFTAPYPSDPPILTMSNLTTDDRDILANHVAEDLVFHDRFAAAIGRSTRDYARGGDL